VRAAFVFQNPRAALAAAVAAGEAPDSTLLGQNHLAALGIDARLHDPALTRGGSAGRLRWSLREVVLPWELRWADAVFTPLGRLFPLVARLRPRLRVVVVNYDLCTTYVRSKRLRRALLRTSVRSCDAVVCLAEAQRAQLLAQTGIAADRAVTVPLGIDAAFFTTGDAPAGGRPVVLSVGKDLARDFATFCAAVAGLDVEARLVTHPRMLAKLDVPPNVTVLQRLSDTELRDEYARATCVVLPQRRDGYPYGSEAGGLTALLEALAMGRPVVATDRAVLRDYVVEGETALVVAPEDPAALRAALERVLGEPALAESLGRNARAAVEARFTTERFAADLAPILSGAP
jgi:glycosyltransferase involved in cell wall biosynthesis